MGLFGSLFKGITGGGLGKFLGPIGALAGGLLGGSRGRSRGRKAKQGKFKQRSPLSSSQRNILKPYYNQLKDVNKQGINQLQKLINYQPEGLDEIQGPALEQFENQILPSILERFSGAGARSSSALNQTLGESAKGLTTNLAAMRAQGLQNATQVRQNAINQLLGYNQFAANPSFTQNYFKEGSPATPSIWSQLAPIAGRALGGGLGGLFGG